MLQTYPIGLLPLVPNNNNTATLKLVYNSDEKQGVWQYGNRDLFLVCERETTVLTNTNPLPPSEIYTQKLGTATQINCSEWVRLFGNWPLNHDCLYSGNRQDLETTETERERLYFSGFTFDSVSNEWSCEWQYLFLHDFFNSSHEDKITIELRLNFQALTGSYLERHYTDVRG